MGRQPEGPLSSPIPRGTRIALLAVVPLAALVWNWRLFQPGFPVAGDNPSHLSEIFALTEVLLREHGWWTGWFEGDFFGYPLLAYQYPLGKWLAALLGLVVPGGVELAYKLVLVLSWIFPGWVLARRFSRYNLRLGGLLALLYFAAQDQLYFALAGMWNVFLALGFALLAYDALAGNPVEGTGRNASAALWISLAVLAHPFALVLVGPTLAAGIGQVSHWSLRPAARRLASIAVPVALLTSWSWLPWLVSGSWPAVLPKQWDWNPLSPIFPLTATEVAGPHLAAERLLNSWLWDSGGMISALLLTTAALVALLSSRRLLPLFPSARIALLSFGLFLGATVLLILAPPAPLVDAAAMARIGRLSPLLLVFLLWTVGELLPGTRFRHPGRLAVVGLPALLTLSLNLTTLGLHHRDLYRTFSPASPRHPHEAALVRVWEYLRDHPLPPYAGRLLLQDTLYNLPDGPFQRSHILALTWRFTGRWTLGAFCEAFAPTTTVSRTESGRLLGKWIEQWDGPALAEALGTLGVTEVLTCEPRLQTLLAETPGFEETFTAAPFRVYRAVRPRNGLVRAEALRIKVLLWNHARRVLSVASPPEVEGGAGTPQKLDRRLVTVLSNFHPWWSAAADGSPIPVTSGHLPGSLHLEISDSPRVIELEFRPPRLIPALLTLLGIVLLVCSPPTRRQ